MVEGCPENAAITARLRSGELSDAAYLAAIKGHRGAEIGGQHFSNLPEPSQEVHHAAPRCLLRLQDEANAGAASLDGAGIEAWLEFEHECMRWGVDVEISRDDLAALVEASTVLLDRDEHRCLHESDWQRWGRRGGRATLRLYGTSWYSALALKRWGRLDAEDLDRARVIGHGLPIKDDYDGGTP